MRSSALQAHSSPTSLGGEGQVRGQAVDALSAEQRFLIESVRCALGCEAWTDTTSATCPDPDWDLIVDLALKQSIAPLVYLGVSGSGKFIPAGPRAKLRTAYLGAVVRTETVLEPVLRSSLSALAAAGLTPILLKGAALAYRTYLAPSLRPMGDIDLLLPTSELGMASEALRRCGFRAGSESMARPHHLPPFHSPDAGMSVELHDQLVSVTDPLALDLSAAFGRSEEIELLGFRARILGPVDALHHTCLHMACHLYEWLPMRGLTDILALTSRHAREMDWDLLLSIARLSRSGGAVYWPLRLSRDWLGAPIPEYVLSQLTPPWPIRHLMAAVTDPGYTFDGSTPPGGGNEVLYRALRGLSLRGSLPIHRQLAALVGDIFPRSQRVGHLPEKMTQSRVRYAAYLARPVRIARGVLALGRLISGKSSG